MGKEQSIKSHKRNKNERDRDTGRKTETEIGRQTDRELCYPIYCVILVGWLVVLRLNVPVNNFSVISGRSHRFLGN